MARLLALIWPTLRIGGVAADRLRFDSILDRLDDLSPRAEAVADGVALVDVSGLEPTFGDERRIAARAVALADDVALADEVAPAVLAAAPLEVRVGIGDNRWLALLAARIARPSRPGGRAACHRFAPGGGREAIAALPLSLLPADSTMRQRFTLFGLTTMGQLATLPRSAVGGQFGLAGERLQALARGEDPRPLIPRRRPERVTHRQPLDPSVEGLTAIALILRHACGRLCEMLRARSLVPGRASVVLSLESNESLRVEVGFPVPALEPEWIARLLLSRLEEATRARAADPRSADDQHEEVRITALGLTFDRLANPAAWQLPAFDPQVSRWEELRWSLERIEMRFGPGRLWRSAVERPAAALAERRGRLIGIGRS
ncbi:MAG: hypothetical protein M3Y88_05305 [Chloroflexota bacterium]|nr:hypothetical protein [Chloroflexota bacterium]